MIMKLIMRMRVILIPTLTIIFEPTVDCEGV